MINYNKTIGQFFAKHLFKSDCEYYYTAIKQTPFKAYNVPGQKKEYTITDVLSGEKYKNIKKFSKYHDVDWHASLENVACRAEDITK